MVSKFKFESREQSEAVPRKGFAFRVRTGAGMNGHPAKPINIARLMKTREDIIG